MDIKSLYEYVKFDSKLELYDLTKPSFIYRTDFNFNEYEVRPEEEMRIDLIFKSMYNIDDSDAEYRLSDIDIILYINNIDNPFNIKKGLKLIYPSLENISKFRYDLSRLEEEKNNVRDKLLVPNKTTKKDKDRESFKNNDYSLPPVILNKPKDPIRLSNGKFSIGGI